MFDFDEEKKKKQKRENFILFISAILLCGVMGMTTVHFHKIEVRAELAQLQYERDVRDGRGRSLLTMKIERQQLLNANN